MPGRQKLNAEATKQDILDAAGKLFAEKGYQSVTIRQIAEKAGCSHTTIYLYFKDKESLLQALSETPLLELKLQLERILFQTGVLPEKNLESLCLCFIRFCLDHRSMYRILFETGAVRVDQLQPKFEINRIRIGLFNLLKAGMANCIKSSDPQVLLMNSRILFFLLRGIAGTYLESEEPADTLMQRLTPTFKKAVAVLLAGMNLKTKERKRT